MRANWKLLLGILLALVVTGCATPSTAASKKIYFDLERDPAVLVNESGVDIVVEKYNICYGKASDETNVSGWGLISGPLNNVHVRRTPLPRAGDTYIRSGNSVPATGPCTRRSDMQTTELMIAWLYQKSDEPMRKFAVYSNNVDPTDASLHLSITTSTLASSPFQVKFQNTSSMMIIVPLNCRVTDGRYLAGDLGLTHLERQTAEGWEVLRMNLGYCSETAGKDWRGEKWLGIASQMSGTIDLRSAYPADFVLEKGRYRWVTTFCAMFSYNRHCYTSFSPTFDYPPEQAQ